MWLDVWSHVSCHTAFGGLNGHLCEPGTGRTLKMLMFQTFSIFCPAKTVTREYDNLAIIIDKHNHREL